MSKYLAAQYYPENKKDYKKTRKRYKSLYKEEKEKKVTIWSRILQKSTI